MGDMGQWISCLTLSLDIGHSDGKVAMMEGEADAGGSSQSSADFY
ncbi:hypothetical protein G3A_14480 [Bacillus sp. 17376]|nr:hypothetical protein G3A_14480 [Bacillus sp. 17376]